MTITSRAETHYGSMQHVTKTDRQVESDILGKVTANLQKATLNSGDFPQLVKAIHDNRIIWSHFAAHAADNLNKLPNELRADLVSLYEFTEQHSQKVLRKEADVSVLIEVNTAIMRGLSGKGKEE